MQPKSATHAAAAASCMLHATLRKCSQPTVRQCGPDRSAGPFHLVVWLELCPHRNGTERSACAARMLCADFVAFFHKIFVFPLSPLSLRLPYLNIIWCNRRWGIWTFGFSSAPLCPTHACPSKLGHLGFGFFLNGTTFRHANQYEREREREVAWLPNWLSLVLSIAKRQNTARKTSIDSCLLIESSWNNKEIVQVLTERGVTVMPVGV